VVASGAVFGELPGPAPEESDARREMDAHIARQVGLLADRGIVAYAEADIATWGAALGPGDRRKMVGLQVANAYWIDLPESLGADLAPPVRDRFAELAVPVDVVIGGRDLAATRLWARRLAEQAPQANLIEMPGADHFPMLSAAADFERVLRRVLPS
jgi:3-oxoadipate enol-lactonase